MPYTYKVLYDVYRHEVRAVLMPKWYRYIPLRHHWRQEVPGRASAHFATIWKRKIYSTA